MNAVCVYVSTAQLVLQSVDTTDTSDLLGEQRILDITRLFGQLRQLLSCAVCARLLNDPYAPLNNARCQHNVCRLCVRGRKVMRPPCVGCKDLQDFRTYAENKTMRCLLLCYKSLCEHMLGTSFYAQLCRQKAHQALSCGSENVFDVAPVTHMTTCGDIIQEGARYEDILNAFSVDLLQITPLFTKIQPQQHRVISTPTMVPVTPTNRQSISLSVSSMVEPLKRDDTETANNLRNPEKSTALGMTNVSQSLSTPRNSAINKLEPKTNMTAVQKNAHMAPKVGVSSMQQSQQQCQATMPSPLVYTKSFKLLESNTSGLSTHQSSTLSQTNAFSSRPSRIMSPSSATPITYVGPNTPGIVVPIVSSSATTTAPLTIASAKLQSLKRQMAQAQARGSGTINLACGAKAAGLTHDDQNVHASLSFKPTTSVPPCVVAPSTSNIVSMSSVSSSATNTNNEPNATFVCLAVTANSSSVTSVSNTSTSNMASQQQQIRNPPSIKTVSNGSAMYSVLYTGVGNKITIKRKTDADDESGQRKSVATSMPTATLVDTLTPPKTINNVMITTTQPQTNLNKLIAKRRGCRCGNATPTPGKLTCCGQRCPCYVDSKSCIGCKCRGCRNPHRPDGGKIRPVIPELACYEIQMAEETLSLSPSDLQVSNTRTHTLPSATATSPLQLSVQKEQPTSSLLVSEQLSRSTSGSSVLSSQTHMTCRSSSPSSKSATLIPFISLHPISSQQQQQQQMQTIATINDSHQQSNTLPLESVLIQNAEGKYQVVNVLANTSTQQHLQNNGNMHRILNSPQLQITSSASSNSNGACSSSSNNSVVCNVTTLNLICNTTSAKTSSPTIVTSKEAGNAQSILFQQHLQQQKNQQQICLPTSNIITTSANVRTMTTTKTTIPIQLQKQQNHQHPQQKQHLQQQSHQHQFKSNIITMRSTSMYGKNNNTQLQQQATNLTSHDSATTITLSPIIIPASSPNTFKAEAFSDSYDSKFTKNTKSGTITSTTGGVGGNTNTLHSNILSTLYTQSSGLSSTITPTTATMPRIITSVSSLSSGCMGSASGNNSSRVSLSGIHTHIGGTGKTHLLPGLVEIIDASDL